MSLNCRSLRKKTAYIKTLIFDLKLDIILLQETWLKSEDKSIYAEFNELGYKTSKLERTSNKEVGLLPLLIPKKSTNSKHFLITSMHNLII